MKPIYTVRWVSRPIFGPIESGTTLGFTTLEEAMQVASLVERGGRDAVVVCDQCGVLDLVSDDSDAVDFHNRISGAWTGDMVSGYHVLQYAELP